MDSLQEPSILEKNLMLWLLKNWINQNIVVFKELSFHQKWVNMHYELDSKYIIKNLYKLFHWNVHG